MGGCIPSATAEEFLLPGLLLYVTKISSVSVIDGGAVAIGNVKTIEFFLLCHDHRLRGYP